jgi:hypothetical protein
MINEYTYFIVKGFWGFGVLGFGGSNLEPFRTGDFGLPTLEQWNEG